ncbi:hypothetical protein [Cupriavidus sp. WS]|uniref:hypothetical protein n=1 Tax=Cupriavidus sp. WS TaxID=1312922 RepID=UPI0012DD600A|nr:hypothetical protein [Cupriavidus sp. WS]
MDPEFVGTTITAAEFDAARADATPVAVTDRTGSVYDRWQGDAHLISLQLVTPILVAGYLSKFWCSACTAIFVDNINGTSLRVQFIFVKNLQYIGPRRLWVE